MANLPLFTVFSNMSIANNMGDLSMLVKSLIILNMGLFNTFTLVESVELERSQAISSLAIG